MILFSVSGRGRGRNEKRSRSKGGPFHPSLFDKTAGARGNLHVHCRKGKFNKMVRLYIKGLLWRKFGRQTKGGG